MNHIMNRTVLMLAILAAVSCSTGPKDGQPLPLSAEEIAIIMEQDSVMKVYTVCDPEDSLLLRQPCMDFTAEDLQSDVYRTLAEKMLVTVNDPSQNGVGIAGPQVGISRRVVAVMRYDREGKPFGVYPNVRLDSLWGEMTHGPEGCLSVPGRRGTVPRYSTVLVSYTDPETLETVRDTVSGYTAIIFQHETDHLDGVLYVDKADTVFVK